MNKDYCTPFCQQIRNRTSLSMSVAEGQCVNSLQRHLAHLEEFVMTIGA